MSHTTLNIQSILGIEKWQQIQDELASVTKLAIITVDYKGIPVTRHSSCTEFCQIVRANPKTSALCQKCDARGGIEAVRINKSYIYTCHCNIIDAAIPIIINNKFFGSVMVGQVLLKDINNIKYLENVYGSSNTSFSDQNKMFYLYSKLPKKTYRQIKKDVDLIGHVSNYIVEAAIKNLDLQEENRVLKQYFNDRSAKKINSTLDKQLDNIVTEKSDAISKVANTTLKPAIDYIHENFKEKIRLKDMARLCFITDSYFSKLFYKKLGENFSAYVTKLKIIEAKKLLKTTDKTIQEISADIGFNDSSYFINIFKKYEGVTPALFRKHFQSQSKEYKII